MTKERRAIDGELAPDVTLLTLEGSEVHLPDLRGAPVVLTFLRYIG